MFERFTGAARAVVVLAECEARDLGSDQVGTVHLLLGLLESEPGPTRQVLLDAGLTAGAVREELQRCSAPPAAFSDEDAAALTELGIDLALVLSRLADSLGRDAVTGTRPPRRGRVGFSRTAKKSLQLALREAVWLSARSIGAEHLLLGLLRSDDQSLASLLTRFDVDPASLRTATLRSIDVAA